MTMTIKETEKECRRLAKLLRMTFTKKGEKCTIYARGNKVEKYLENKDINLAYENLLFWCANNNINPN